MCLDLFNSLPQILDARGLCFRSACAVRAEQNSLMLFRIVHKTSEFIKVAIAMSLKLRSY